MDWPEDIITEYLDVDTCVPAVGQGALAIECREEDTELRELLSHINDDDTTKTVTAERTFLHLMEGGCQVPIAGYAYLDNGEIVLSALVASPDGKEVIHEIVRGNDPKEVGALASEKILAKGGKALIDKAKEELE